MPAATVAVIEGSAFGGGAELSTACDFRVMQEQARIRFVHTVMGVSPGASQRSSNVSWPCSDAHRVPCGLAWLQVGVGAHG